MRLGLRPTVFEPETESWSKIRKLYGGAAKIWERHRHRYEVNPEYVEKLQKSGLEFIGKDEKGERMQVLELRGAWPRFFMIGSFANPTPPSGHPFFLGLQAHPEFCTRPLNPSPPFLGLVAAASDQTVLQEQLKAQESFRPPHPEHSMVNEASLRTSEHWARVEEGVLVNGDT